VQYVEGPRSEPADRRLVVAADRRLQQKCSWIMRANTYEAHRPRQLHCHSRRSFLSGTPAMASVEPGLFMNTCSVIRSSRPARLFSFGLNDLEALVSVACEAREWISVHALKC